jgi:hypothetical protein
MHRCVAAKSPQLFSALVHHNITPGLIFSRPSRLSPWLYIRVLTVLHQRHELVRGNVTGLVNAKTYMIEMSTMHAKCTWSRYGWMAVVLCDDSHWLATYYGNPAALSLSSAVSQRAGSFDFGPIHSEVFFCCADLIFKILCASLADVSLRLRCSRLGN